MEVLRITDVLQTIDAEYIKEVVKETNLKHIAIIMDGNRRWAKEKFLPAALGHQKGVESLKATLKGCALFGVKYLTVYAFSTENWNRKKEEVDFLMGLLAKTLSLELEEMHKNNVKIKFIGNISTLNDDLKRILKNAEEYTKNNNGVNLQIAFNYGARDELVNAVRTIAKLVKEDKLDIHDINEKTIASNLYTADVPDPDLLIRTGGEKRISNYLLWQIAYSEVFITDQYWPEFNEKSLADAILEFKCRNRRYGK